MLIKAVKATNPDGQITDLLGTIASVNVAGNSFVMQGPFGHQFTVDVNGNTNYNSGFSLDTLPTSGGFVSLQGTVQMDGSILASDVEFITTDRAFISGRILAVNRPGAGATVTLWVGETGAGLGPGGHGADGGCQRRIQLRHLLLQQHWFTPNNLFGSSSMLVGQRIFIGGSFGGTFTPDFISLRRQGVYGLVVPGSVTVTSGNAGDFQLLNTGLLGILWVHP